MLAEARNQEENRAGNALAYATSGAHKSFSIYKSLRARAAARARETAFQSACLTGDGSLGRILHRPQLPTPEESGGE